MTARRPDPTGRSGDELLVLHAVRLAGFADTEAIADRADVAAGTVGDTLRGLEAQQLIERMVFGDSGGWILTEAGKARDAELLQEEAEAVGVRLVLHTTVEDFESTLNPRLVRTITDWQLQSPSDRTGTRIEVLRELTDLARALNDLMAELTGLLPRFGRYARQFSAALRSAHSGDDQWVAGVGRLSCHTVWAELHQDLLSSLGRGRSTEPRHGGS